MVVACKTTAMLFLRIIRERNGFRKLNLLVNNNNYNNLRVVGKKNEYKIIFK